MSENNKTFDVDIVIDKKDVDIDVFFIALTKLREKLDTKLVSISQYGDFRFNNFNIKFYEKDTICGGNPVSVTVRANSIKVLSDVLNVITPYIE